MLYTDFVSCCICLISCRLLGLLLSFYLVYSKGGLVEELFNL